MKINRIDHLCIAVKDLEAARKAWEPLLGREGPDETYEDPNEKIRVARYYLGNVGLELMASTSPDGDVAKFVEKRGEGLMVLSFNVDDTREAVAELREKGYPLIPDARNEVVRPFGDCTFAFVHPKRLNGVLTEVIDDRRPPPR